jgi:hypothetical protein
VSEQRFRYTDFFDPNLLREISQVRDAFRQVRKEAEAIKGIMPAKYSGAKDYRKATASQQEMNKVMKEYEAVMKEVERLDKRIEAERIKQTATIRRKAMELERERQKTSEKVAEDRREITAEKEKRRARESLERQRQRGLAAMAREEHKQRELIAAANIEVRSIEDLRKKNNALIRVRDRLDITTRQGKAEFDRLTAAIQRNDKALRTAEYAAGRYQRNVGKYWSSLNGMGGKLMGAVGLAGGIYGAVRLLRNMLGIMSDFDQKMANVRAITGATGDEFERLRQNAIELGATTVFRATQIAQLQTEYGKLGFTIQEILDATRATQDLAAATQEGLADSAIVVGSTIRGFGMEAKEAVRVTDVMARSFTSSALDLTKFRESMKYVAPVAREVGLEIEDVTAMLATLADAGISGSMAGTSLRMMLLRLATTGKPVKEALDDMINGTLTLSDAHDEFGQRAMVAAMILNNNSEKMDQLTQSFREAEGAAREMAAIQLNTLTGEVTLLGSAWEGFILTLEDGQGRLAKSVRGIVATTRSMIDALTQAAEGADRREERRAKSREEGLKKRLENLKALGKKEVQAEYDRISEIWELKSIELRYLEQNEERLKKKQRQELDSLRNAQVYYEGVKALLTSWDKAHEEATDNVIERELKLSELTIAKLKSMQLEAQMTGDEVLAERIGFELQERRKAFDAHLDAVRRSEKLQELDDQMNQYTLAMLDWMDNRDEQIRKRTDDMIRAKEAAMDVWFDMPLEEDPGESPEIKRIMAEADYQRKLFKETYEFKKKALQDALDAGEIGWTEYNHKVGELHTERLNHFLSNMQQITSTFSQFASQQVSLYRNMENQKLSDMQARLASGVISEQEYEDEKLKVQKAYAKKRQQIEISEATARGAMVVLNALNTQPWWVGLLQGTIAMGMVTQQVNLIKSQKYGRGEVDIKGKKHSQGGIPAEIEGGESVINAAATARAKKTLEMINEGRLSDQEVLSALKHDSIPAVGQIHLHIRKSDQDMVRLQKQLLAESQTTNELLRRWKWISEDGKTVMDINGNKIRYV